MLVEEKNPFSHSVNKYVQCVSHFPGTGGYFDTEITK